jgi:hypothetical protein
LTRVAEPSSKAPERPKGEASEASPAPRAEPEGQEVLSPVAFPLVVLESVRWHPSAERRAARMRIDQAGPLDVREGDIVAGVLIELIRPAAVQLRLGANTRLFFVEP